MSARLPPSLCAALARSVRGPVLLPGNARYEEARVLFNAMIDRRPAVIVQCMTPADVAHAVRFAQDVGLEVAVRGGGHGVAGTSLVDDGLVIDLRRMNAATVDPVARTVTIGGGATMSQLDRATARHGLATTGGRVSTTGIAGFALGGGTGWLDRRFGLACDNLAAVEIVTADGALVRTDQEENAELFWALHGGGGNFGVATELTFRLHELESVAVALLLWPPDAAPGVLRTYRDFMSTAPDATGGGAFFLTGPAETFVPAGLVGRLAFAILVVYTGTLAALRTVCAPLLAADHCGEMIDSIPYADLQCLLDDPPGYRNYWSAEHLDAFPDEAIERLCARAAEMPVPSPSQCALFPQGGVAGRTCADFPLPWRRAAWCVHPFGLWQSSRDDERAIEWARAVRRDMHPWSTGAVYLNFIGDEGVERARAGFGADGYARLARLKGRIDPRNVFRATHSVTPA